MAFDVRDGMRDKNDGDAARAQFMNLAHAAMAEISVPHRERFVNDQNLGVHADRDCERQPHRHPA